VTPSMSEANQIITLVNETKMEATDSFTQKKISKLVRELMSSQLGDITTNTGMGIVQE